IGEGWTSIVAGGGYTGTHYVIEPDASAASYFWAAAAITGGKVKVCGLTRQALQGDVGFVDVLGRMGCDVSEASDGITVEGRPLRGIDVDMNAISDTVQTLAIVALFAEGPTRVRGVAHNRFKETDRIGDLACELRKLGGVVEEHEDGLTIHPTNTPDGEESVILDTYHDHRMAMSLSLAGLRRSGVQISNPSCTSKTYPNYFHDLEALTGTSHIWRSPPPSQ
ncbi:MAG: 3-phosphoshikimate 1-carboxyvinyltransferase, partial [Planctomycetota bacterium]